MTIQQLLLSVSGASDSGVVYDLTLGSTPAGMTASYGQSGPSLSWSYGVGVAMYGNAGSNSYPLRLTTAFSGDYLFQLSTSCLLYTSPSPRDATLSRMPSSA